MAIQRRTLIKTHKAGIYGIAAVVGLGGLLFGYDIGVISGVLEMQQFKDVFPYNSWQKGEIVTFFIVGNAIGAMCSSFLGDWLGRRSSIQIGCVVFILGGLLQTLASGFAQLYVGRVISGLAVGVTAALVPLYNAELAPAALRGRMITFNQLAMTGGIAVSFWTNYVLDHFNVHHNWRIAVGIQIVPAALLLLLSFWLPKSPRWLAKKGDIPGAKQSLLRLRGKDNVDAVLDELEEINVSVQEEIDAGTTSWAEFLRPSTRRQTALGMFVMMGQQLTGINCIMYYAPQIFESLGFSSSKLLAQGINGVVNFLATFIAFFFVDRAGRRVMFLAGALGMGAGMMLLGMLGVFFGRADGGIRSHVAGYVCIGAIFLFVACFAFSWGPVGWIYPTEAFSTAQRARGVAITTTTNFVFNIMVALFVPQLQESIGFLLYLAFAACLALLFVVTLFCLPETKGRSLEELQHERRRRAAKLSIQGIPAAGADNVHSH